MISKILFGHLWKLQPDGLQPIPVEYEGFFDLILDEKELRTNCLSIRPRKGVTIGHWMIGHMFVRIGYTGKDFRSICLPEEREKSIQRLLIYCPVLQGRLLHPLGFSSLFYLQLIESFWIFRLDLERKSLWVTEWSSILQSVLQERWR